MNIETVNELIASLESAGELSIKETKVMALAKAFKQLAAENAGLKAFGDKLSEMHNALNGEGTGIQGRAEVACQQVALEAAMEEFDAIETPATDAYLAGIKADGATAAGNYLKLEAQHMPVVERLMMQDAAEICYGTAARLREGADK